MGSTRASSTRIFIELGAPGDRGRGDDVPDGGARLAARFRPRSRETVAFLWVEWPGQGHARRSMKKMMEDLRMDSIRPRQPAHALLDGKAHDLLGFRAGRRAKP